MAGGADAHAPALLLSPTESELQLTTHMSECGTGPRLALVTGAAGGIGLAIARQLHAMGLRIAAWDAAEMPAERVAADPARVMAQRVDVSDRPATEQALAWLQAQWGPVSILINNAGISPKRADRTGAGILDVDPREWSRVIDVNLTSLLSLMQLVVPGMVAQRWGRVVNVASQAARTRAPVPGVAYVCTKTAVLGLSRYAAEEFGPHGITVNTLAPGRISSPMTDVVGAEVNAAFIGRTPVRRLGTPEDVAAAAAFYVSEQASFLNGTILDVNGGLYMP